MKCRICDDDESIDSEEHYLKCSKVMEHFNDNNEDIKRSNADDDILKLNDDDLDLDF